MHIIHPQFTYERKHIMLITIGLFLAVVLLLIIGYIGEVISSASQKQSEKEGEESFEADAAIENHHTN